LSRRRKPGGRSRVGFGAVPLGFAKDALRGSAGRSTGDLFIYPLIAAQTFLWDK